MKSVFAVLFGSYLFVGNVCFMQIMHTEKAERANHGFEHRLHEDSHAEVAMTLESGNLCESCMSRAPETSSSACNGEHCFSHGAETKETENLSPPPSLLPVAAVTLMASPPEKSNTGGSGGGTSPPFSTDTTVLRC